MGHRFVDMRTIHKRMAQKDERVRRELEDRMPYLLNGKTAREERHERKVAKAAELRAVYAIVDRRDEGQCRACGRRCSTTAIGEHRGEHHHILARSVGGMDTKENVALVCIDCHDERHKKGTLRISGDAHERNEMGFLCGLMIERLTESGWKVEAMA